MEFEPISYIFGSYTRRKQSSNQLNVQTKNVGVNNESRKLLNPALKCVDGESEGNFAKGRHAHSKSQPETGNVGCGGYELKNSQDYRFQRTQSCIVPLQPSQDKSLLPATCPICKHVFLEPRVLECLHSFCTRCLLDAVEKNRDLEVWLPTDDSNNEVKTPKNDVNQIICPICKDPTFLNRHGVFGLSPNYIIQHRLVLATLNDENTKLLCDLCSGESIATSRCSDCLVNLCEICIDVHKRHAMTNNHELLTLKEVRRQGIMKIHRQIMCQTHPELELIAYCSTCFQTACKICLNVHHTPKHQYQSCSSAAVAQGGRLRRLLNRAKSISVQEYSLHRRLFIARRSVERRIRFVKQEVEKYMDEYRKAVENHREKLLKEVENIKTSFLSQLNTFETNLNSRLQNSSTAINFSQNLLEEGSDVELLTFVGKLLKKLEDLEKPMKITEDIKDLLKQVGREKCNDDGLVDYVPSKSSKKLENDLLVDGRRKSFSSNEETKIDIKLNNSKINNSEEINENLSKSVINQINNCLDNIEETKDIPKKQHKLTCLNNISHSNQIHSSEDSILLEFLPLEPDIEKDRSIPIIFGKIKKLSSSFEYINCCSATRPHLGGSPTEKSKICCAIKEKTLQDFRKSECNEKFYQITL